MEYPISYLKSDRSIALATTDGRQFHCQGPHEKRRELGMKINRHNLGGLTVNYAFLRNRFDLRLITYSNAPVTVNCPVCATHRQ